MAASLLGVAKATELEELPAELQLMFAEYLDAKSLARLSETCKGYHELLQPLFLCTTPSFLMELADHRERVKKEKSWGCSFHWYQQRLRGLRLVWHSPVVEHDFFQWLANTFHYLETLEIDFQIEVTDACLEALSSMKRLKKLEFSNCMWLTDAGIAHLTKLTELRSLKLMRCYVLTDAALARLSEIISLHNLYLSDTPYFTNAGLGYLPNLKNLRCLNIYNCSSITKQGVERLCKALPACVIYY
jgi:hypothetical protein